MVLLRLQVPTNSRPQFANRGRAAGLHAAVPAAIRIHDDAGSAGGGVHEVEDEGHQSPDGV